MGQEMTRIINPETPRTNNTHFKVNDDGKIVPRDDSIEDRPTREMSVVCVTPGCSAEGVGFDVVVGENYDSIYQVECAQCHLPPDMHEPGSIETNNEWVKPRGAKKLTRIER